MKRIIIALAAFFAFMTVDARQCTVFSVNDIGVAQYIGEGKKSIGVSSCWKCVRGGTFTPTVAGFSGPMLRVQSCGVDVDFDGYCIKNGAGVGQFAIGIEVGYPKPVLVANPSLQQVHTVTISNAVFEGFDIGILVHRGVRKVIIENCTIIGSSIGILFAGESALNCVECVEIRNTKVIGRSDCAAQTALVAKIEGSSTAAPDCQYNYGAPFFGAPFDAGTGAPYAGIYGECVKGAVLDNVVVTRQGSTTCTEAALGIAFLDSEALDFNAVQVSGVASLTLAVGMEFKNDKNVDVHNSEVTGVVSQTLAIGIDAYEVAPAVSKDLNFENVEVTCLTASSGSVADPKVFGIKLSDVSHVHFDKVSAEALSGQAEATGLWFNNVDCADVNNSIFACNKATRSTDGTVSHNNSCNSIANGVYVSNGSEGVNFVNIHANDNVGQNMGHGMYIVSSSLITVEGSSFDSNKGELACVSECDNIVTQAAANEISVHGPVVSAARTGGFGIKSVSSSRIDIFHSHANGNNGHRAAGIWFLGGDLCNVKHVSANDQSANGDYLNTTAVAAIADLTAVAITPAANVDLLLQGGSSPVNLIAAIQTWIQKIDAFRTSWSLATTPLSGCNVNIGAALAVMNQIEAVLALYRCWGTAIGIHAHNMTNSNFYKVTATGNISLNDSAIGVLFSGRSKNNIFDDAVCSLNQAWTASVQAAPAGIGYTYQYDLGAVAPLWAKITAIATNKLNPVAANVNTVGFNTTAGGLVAQGEVAFGATPNVSPLWVSFDTNTTKYALVALPGYPTAAGVIAGDRFEIGRVSDVTAENNLGNSGLAFGIAADQALLSIFQNNLVVGNAVNIYGMAAGLFDSNNFASNAWLQNYMTRNMINGFYNANHILQYNMVNTDSLKMDACCVFSRSCSPSGGLNNIEVFYLPNCFTIPTEDGGTSCDGCDGDDAFIEETC